MATEATLRYVKPGDATRPKADGFKLIVHCCNNRRAWGKGFVTAIDKRWSRPRDVFSRSTTMLGTVSYACVEDDIAVANVIGQDGYGVDGRCYVLYEALREGFRRVFAVARTYSASVHCPRLGCGLAGGRWDAVERLLREEFVAKGVSVTVYDP